MAARKKATTRRKKAEPASRGLGAEELEGGDPPEALAALEKAVREAGGRCLARYRDPLGGAWLALAALPIERVAPTPFQRDLSDAHVKKLADVLEKLGSYLDPVIAVPVPEDAAESDGEAREARFWTPNGHHRLSAMKRIGAKSVTALLSPDPALAYRILALNTEKAHNLKERALEAVRMARGLAEVDPERPETDYALELEEGALVTLGCAYEERKSFAGGAYAPSLRPSDVLESTPVAKALEARRERAKRLLALDDRVAEIIAELKERGFESPYLRNFVVSRLRPYRKRGQEAPSADALLDEMERKAERFDASKVRPDQVARSGGGGGEG